MNVLESAKFISERSSLVSIDLNAIDRVASNLLPLVDSHEFSLARWKEHELNPHVADEKAIDWIFLCDALNFSFWDDQTPPFAVSYKGKKYTGYWSLCAALNRALDEKIPLLDASYLAQMTEKDVAHVFRTEPNHAEIPLLSQRVAVMNEIGSVLKSKFDGTLRTLISQSNQSALEMVRLVVENFPCFRDETFFQGQRLKIYKRVQILVADVWACFEGVGFGNFKDIDSITMFADYRVPQKLADLGILKYTEGFLKTLESKQMLPSGSQGEVEIRGNSIWSVELLLRKVNELRSSKTTSSSSTTTTSPTLEKTWVNAIMIDFYLWDQAKLPIPAIYPIHRTRSIFY